MKLSVHDKNVVAVDLASTVLGITPHREDPEEKPAKGQKIPLEDFDSLCSLVSSPCGPENARRGPNQRLLQV
jgi:hypothetical protein